MFNHPVELRKGGVFYFPKLELFTPPSTRTHLNHHLEASARECFNDINYRNADNCVIGFPGDEGLLHCLNWETGYQ